MKDQSSGEPHLDPGEGRLGIPLKGVGPWLLGRGASAQISFPDDPHCSREQLRILRLDGGFEVEPLSSNTPTFLNRELLSRTEWLKEGDELAFGLQRLRFKGGGPPRTGPTTEGPVPAVHGLLIGRTPSTKGLHLDHPNVSRRHAQLEVVGTQVGLRDLGSTNGTFVNGMRTEGSVSLRAGDRVHVGPFQLTFTGTHLEVEDRSGNVRLVGYGLSRVVPTPGGSGTIAILKNASVRIEPREFACIIGPSGSGKSTLMNALSGRERATEGRVLLNDTDLYRSFESVKRDMAMVPQYNVLHEELTLRQALDYTGRLRLPTDLGPDVRQALIEKAAQAVELGHRLDTPIARLSGGQKKRASLASETLNRPSVLFLDEVTSGLDESTDRDIMILLKRMAEAGMTIVCVTHTLANIEECCHRLVVMGEAGEMVFSGSPTEAKTFFGIASLGQIFDRISEEGTSTLRDRFESLPRRREEVRELTQAVPEHSGQASSTSAAGSEDHRGGLGEAVRQFGVLVSRNARLLAADRRGLGMALAQSVVIGTLLGYTFSQLGDATVAEGSRSSLMLLLGLSALWLGCNGASKEIVGERPIFLQERNVNLSVGAFVSAKFVVSGVSTLLQVALMFALTAMLAEEIPGAPMAQLLVLLTGSLAGTALGLTISALTDTRDQATTLVPLALVPQFILSKVIAPAMPSLALRFSEVFVTGYWIVEAMRAIYVETDGPIVLSPPGVQPEVHLEATASSVWGVSFILAHALVFLLVAYGVTWMRSRPSG